MYLLHGCEGGCSITAIDEGDIQHANLHASQLYQMSRPRIIGVFETRLLRDGSLS